MTVPDASGLQSSGQSRLAGALTIVGMGVVCGAALLAAMVVHEPFPFFDVDPLTIPPAVTPQAMSANPILDALAASLAGIGPTASLVLSVIALFGAVLVLAGEGIAGRGVSLIAVVLAGVGSVGAMRHGLIIEGGSLENLRIGSAWVAAIWSGVAAWHAGRSRPLGHLVAGIAIAFVVVLALKGAAQVWIEHPMTMASYRDNRETFLAARGWSPDSASARAYERRLGQGEATGWFGLSNVLASFAAAALAGLVTLLVAQLTSRRDPETTRDERATPGARWQIWVLGTGAAIAAGLLLLTHSKGGIGAAIIGIVLGIGAVGITRYGSTSRWLQRPASLLASARGSGIIAVGACVGVLWLVVIRGLLGERISELSILFRWFYMQAAVRIFGDHPLLGVGPGDFQAAYALAKPAINPEEVTSPHSLFLDHAATLGLFGVAWVALVLWMIWSVGRQLGGTTARIHRAMPMRARWYFLALVAALPLTLSIWLQRGASILGVLAMAFSPADPIPTWALLASVGLLGLTLAAWVGLAWVIASVLTSTPRAAIALGAVGITLAVHAQIEMTPIQPASAGLFFVILGACANGSGLAQRAIDRWLWFAGPIVTGLLGLWIASAVPRIARWESSLAQAARLLAPLAQIDTSQTITQREVLAQSQHALQHLEQAQDHLGTEDLPTRRSRVRMKLTLAQGQIAQGQLGRARRFIDEAEQIARESVGALPDRSGAWALLAGVLDARSDLLDEPSTESAYAWERVHELSPYALGPVLRLVDLAERAGDTQAHRRWARLALELDDNLRLDPLRQLSERQRRALFRASNSP